MERINKSEIAQKKAENDILIIKKMREKKLNDLLKKMDRIQEDNNQLLANQSKMATTHMGGHIGSELDMSKRSNTNNNSVGFTKSGLLMNMTNE